MSIASKVRSGRPVAVFTRNHRIYLDETSGRKAHQPTTFRALTRWASADVALKERSPRAIYIAPIEGGGSIEFVADLHVVHLKPIKGQPKTEEMLKYVLPSTKDERIWVNGEGTLYAIKNCRKLSRPFPMTKLIKVSDGTPLSEDYSYSYSVVYEHDCR